MVLPTWRSPVLVWILGRLKLQGNVLGGREREIHHSTLPLLSSWTFFYFNYSRKYGVQGKFRGFLNPALWIWVRLHQMLAEPPWSYILHNHLHGPGLRNLLLWLTMFKVCLSSLICKHFWMFLKSVFNLAFLVANYFYNQVELPLNQGSCLALKSSGFCLCFTKWWLGTIFCKPFGWLIFLSLLFFTL